MNKFTFAPKLASGSLILALAFALFFRNRGDFSHLGSGDFKVYLLAASRVRAGLSPYLATDSSPYKYSPGFLIPLLFLPKASGSAWMVFKLLCVSAWGLALRFGARYTSWTKFGALCLGVAVTWKGLIEALDYGQVEFFFFGGAVLAAIFIRRKSFFWAGLVLGILPWIKLPWILFSTFFIATAYYEKKLSRYFCGILSGTATFALIFPILQLGLTKTLYLYQAWISLLKDQPSSLFQSEINQSFFISFLRWEHLPGIFSYVIPLVAMLWIGILMIKVIFRIKLLEQNPEPLPIATPALILTQLLNPLAWRWGSLLMVGAFMGKKPNRLVLALVFLLFLLELNPVVKTFGLSHWTDLHRYSLVTLDWMALLSLSL